ncbi:MAG: GCN5 family acetyltransferase [Smithella sp. SDB]|nr:MAG: GCN5 family acetyltransferase [Smithella sp. SDB]
MIVSIEPAVESEVPEILCIMAFANMHHVPSEEMPDLDWRCFFVARLDGAMAGAAGYRILDDTSAKTTLMAVDPACRGYGIGMLLQERRMRTLFEKGIRKLTTNADRPETIRWYQKHFGYRVVGSLKKVHEFGHPDIHEWTTLETDLVEWGKRAAN